MMIPNKRNFCGGNFQDWLEVMLTEKCNGKCSWCIEKKGYRPKHHCSWAELTSRILGSGKKNIILLGGEPTLYPDLKPFINDLVVHGRNVYITTNGSTLSSELVDSILTGITGINISIHADNLWSNSDITGINLDSYGLSFAIERLRYFNIAIRLNCNLIKGYIDSKARIEEYLAFAKSLLVDSVRFAELKQDPDNFVSLYSIYGNEYGINNEPFGLGCNNDTRIDGMPVNFRQMCGLQTTLREKPIDPQQIVKRVLYYDGIFYDGWQTREECNMTEKEVLELLLKVVDKDISIIEAAKLLTNKDIKIADSPEPSTGAGCQY